MAQAESSVTGIPYFYLLQPEAIPRGRRAFRRLGFPTREALLDACGGAGSPAGLETLARACASLGLPPVGPARVRVSPRRPGAVAGYPEHDVYCHIIRVKGDAPKVFVRTIPHAYRALLREQRDGGTSLDGDDWMRLRGALESILLYVLRRPPAVPPSDCDPPPPGREQTAPIRRWIIGHHIFLAIIQGLVLVLHDLGSALAAGRQREAREALELCASLLGGTALAFRFAADFPPADYQEVVRPSMMPPLSPPGLSGLLSADHAYLMRAFAALKPALENLGPELGPCYSRFRAAFKAAYEAHRLVCERFQGGEKPSLRQAAESEESAVEILDRFRHVRMKMLPDGPSRG